MHQIDKKKRKRSEIYFVNKYELENYFEEERTPEFVPITKLTKGNDMTKRVRITVEEL